MTDGHFIEGLEDVVALSSEICFIDGDEGRLVYRGYDIHDLIKGSASFEEVVYLLWHGELPTKDQLSELDADLRGKRALNKDVLAALKTMPRDGNVMEMLRTLVSLTGLYDPDDQDNSYEGSVKKATRLVAQMSTVVAAIERYRSGQEPLVPNDKLNHAANFLYMLLGKEPDEYTARAFEIALILHADHELNASTFAARVTAGTLSDIYSAIVSAIGALKGPLHGGANEQVMLMLQEIGEPSKAPEWIKNALAQKRRIMGFGHRVYHTEDPRATHLREMSKEMGERRGNTTYYEMSRIVEQAVKEQKGLYPNVDFYSASTYFMMNIPIHVFTPVFAVSRISGWTAHVLEQYRNNRLIRPRAEYVGIKRRPYISMDQR